MENRGVEKDYETICFSIYLDCALYNDKIIERKLKAAAWL